MGEIDRNGSPPLSAQELREFREDHPMDHLALVALAAWVNVRPDQLPDTMRAHNCPSTIAAWGRVSGAIREAVMASLGWQSMETAPTDGTEILLWCGHPVCGYFSTDREDPEVEGEGSFVLDANWPGMTEPTHWMPIEPPTTAAGNRFADMIALIKERDQAVAEQARAERQAEKLRLELENLTRAHDRLCGALAGVARKAGVLEEQSE